MVRKKCKCPLFLVCLVLSMCLLSLLVVSAFAVEGVVNGGAENGSYGWNTNVGEFEYSAGGRSGNCFNDSLDDSNYGFDFYQVWSFVPVENITDFSFYWETNGEATTCTLSVYVNVRDWQSESYYEEGWATVYVDNSAGAASWENINLTAALEAFGYTVADAVGGVGIYIQTNDASNWVAVDDVTFAYTLGDYVPPPDETPVIDDSLSVIEMLTWLFVALIILFIPAVILGIYAKLGMWGFITGLDIGAALGYIFLNKPYVAFDYFPIWIPFLMVICTIGLAYRSVK